ncbi:MAG TPA: SRPBCC domain-containing protein, partial [Thermomicrobiales bacterium]|nr:SRPBCC domain-containing protein [Thermomicrobiales bacterium]
MAKTQITAEPGVPQIVTEREFDAPRDLLFRAFTDPDLLPQWLGPREYTMIIDRFELRDGGRWRFWHREADGGEQGFHGVFHGEPSADGIVRTFE